jgi:hypothetical protein
MNEAMAEIAADREFAGRESLKMRARLFKILNAKTIAVVTIGLVTAVALEARAGLGGNEASVEGDRAQIGAPAVQKSVVAARTAVPGSSVSTLAAAAPSYSVHQMTVHGNTIKEYVSSDGVVFAVTWRGMTVPDLSVLMASYYNEYSVQETQRKRVKGQRSYDVRTAALLVHRGGNQRDLRGKAIVSQLVPAGIDLEAIQ